MKKSVALTAWILTPVVASIGAFLMGWLGASIGGRLVWLIVGGLVGALVFLIVWRVLISFLKRRKTPAEV